MRESEPRASALDKQDLYKAHSYLVLALCLLLCSRLSSTPGAWHGSCWAGWKLPPGGRRAPCVHKGRATGREANFLARPSQQILKLWCTKRGPRTKERNGWPQRVAAKKLPDAPRDRDQASGHGSLVQETPPGTGDTSSDFHPNKSVLTQHLLMKKQQRLCYRCQSRAWCPRSPFSGLVSAATSTPRTQGPWPKRSLRF